MTATVIGLAGVSETRADDAAVVAEIVAGIRERETLVKDLHMRLSTEVHRTDAYFEMNARPQDAATNRRLRTSTGPLLPRDEASTYEVFDRPPYRALVAV